LPLLGVFPQIVCPFLLEFCVCYLSHCDQNFSQSFFIDKGPSIDASYQVSVHMAEGFQRRRLKSEKLTDDERQVMAKAHFAFGKVAVGCFSSNCVSFSARVLCLLPFSL
jgi:hypothetical protein